MSIRRCMAILPYMYIYMYIYVYVIMSHPEFSENLSGIISMITPEESPHWEQKPSQELGDSHPKDD